METAAIENPYSPAVSLEIGFENSNPSRVEDVEVETSGAYVITQFLEEGAGKGYSFHLHVALVNRGKRGMLVPLRIVWAEADYDYCRDYLYVGYDNGQTWRMLVNRSRRGVTTDLQLVVPPGRHLLCCSPKFDYQDSCRLLDHHGQGGLFTRMDVATTPEGRTISCLRGGNPAGVKTVITTRAHPYETAGGYCMAGWLEHVSTRPADCAGILDKLDLYLFPMINPDGVANGYCCLSPSGVNYGWRLVPGAEQDRGARGLVDFIMNLRPAFYLDMHNNTGPHFEDRVEGPSQEFLDRFAALVPDRSCDQKVWRSRLVSLPEGYLPADCHARFSTKMSLVEFPWYTRLPADMKEHGRLFLTTWLSVVADMSF